MTEQEAIDETVKHLDDAPVPVEDKRPFWIRLLESCRVKISGTPPNKIEIDGGTDF